MFVEGLGDGTQRRVYISCMYNGSVAIEMECNAIELYVRCRMCYCIKVAPTAPPNIWKITSTIQIFGHLTVTGKR